MVHPNGLLSGDYTTAVAHVEAADAEDWFVSYRIYKELDEILAILTSSWFCHYLLTGAMSYIPQPSE